jgi:Glutamine phosphoribosylpyrophosphate amidotransferase
MTMITGSGMIAIAHNGDLTTYAKVKKKYLDAGAVFQTDSDTELIINILNKYLGQNSDVVLSIRATMGEIDGAYALALMVNGRLFGIRDPHGIRPSSSGS